MLWQSSAFRLTTLEMLWCCTLPFPTLYVPKITRTGWFHQIAPSLPAKDHVAVPSSFQKETISTNLVKWTNDNLQMGSHFKRPKSELCCPLNPGAFFGKSTSICIRFLVSLLIWKHLGRDAEILKEKYLHYYMSTHTTSSSFWFISIVRRGHKKVNWDETLLVSGWKPWGWKLCKETVPLLQAMLWAAKYFQSLKA